MFCVLETNKIKRSFFDVFRKNICDECDFKTVPVYKGAPFIIMTVSYKGNEPQWNYIVKKAGRCAKRLIVSKNINLPNNSKIGEFKSTILKKEMMKNTFLKIIKNNYDKKAPFEFCIIDKKGNNTEFVRQIAPYALKISVCTKNKQKYDKISEQIMEEIGLCISLRDETIDSQIKIDAERCIMTIKNNKKYINITDGIDFIVPDVYEKLMPIGVNKYDFYSALYELCGVFTIADCIFDTIIVNDKKISIDKVCFT